MGIQLYTQTAGQGRYHFSVVLEFRVVVQKIGTDRATYTAREPFSKVAQEVDINLRDPFFFLLQKRTQHFRYLTARAEVK